VYLSSFPPRSLQQWSVEVVELLLFPPHNLQQIPLWWLSSAVQWLSLVEEVRLRIRQQLVAEEGAEGARLLLNILYLSDFSAFQTSKAKV
jgi:hypothetical protein